VTLLLLLNVDWRHSLLINLCHLVIVLPRRRIVCCYIWCAISIYFTYLLTYISVPVLSNISCILLLSCTLPESPPLQSLMSSPVSALSASQSTFKDVCLVHRGSVLWSRGRSISVLAPWYGYKFSVCADLVRRRFISSVIFPADSQHLSIRHLKGFQLAYVAGHIYQ